MLPSKWSPSLHFLSLSKIPSSYHIAPGIVIPNLRCVLHGFLLKFLPPATASHFLKDKEQRPQQRISDFHNQILAFPPGLRHCPHTPACSGVCLLLLPMNSARPFPRWEQPHPGSQSPILLGLETTLSHSVFSSMEPFMCASSGSSHNRQTSNVTESVKDARDLSSDWNGFL